MRTATYTTEQLKRAQREFESLGWPIAYDGEWWVYISGPVQGRRVHIEEFENLFQLWIDRKKQQTESAVLGLFGFANIGNELAGLAPDVLRSQRLFYSSRGRQAFRRDLERIVKENHAIAYLIGTGGLKNLTPQDRIFLQNFLRGEFKYLERFLNSIKDDGGSIAAIIQRATLYPESFYGTMNDARIRKGIRDGNRWKWSELDPTVTPENHCRGCVVIHNLGWVPIAFGIPAPGHTNRKYPRQCLNNCRCRLHLSKSKTRPRSGPRFALDSQMGWVGKASLP